VKGNKMITLLHPHPAALLETQQTRTMIIADLHIGWEISLAKQGIHVPAQAPKLLQKLESLIATYKPDKLLILGDIKHTVATAETSEWHDIPDFFNELTKHIKHTSIIRGNHDGNLEPLLPETIEMLPATGIALEDTGLFHGHCWPSPTLLKCKTLVMAHIHPVVTFRDQAGFRITRQVWINARCNTKQLAKLLLQKSGTKTKKATEETLLRQFNVKPKTSQLFIMPSFNDFLGGKPLNETRKHGHPENETVAGPLLRSQTVNMNDAEAYLLDGTFLGTLNQLKALK